MMTHIIKYILIAFLMLVIPPAFLPAQETLQDSIIVNDGPGQTQAGTGETGREYLSLQTFEKPPQNQPHPKGKETEIQGTVGEITPVDTDRETQTKNTNLSSGSEVTDTRKATELPVAPAVTTHAAPATENTGAAEPSLVVPFEREKSAPPPAPANPLTMDDASLKNPAGSLTPGAAEPSFAVPFEREKPILPPAPANPLIMDDASLKKPTGSFRNPDTAAYHEKESTDMPLDRPSLARAVKEISGAKDDAGDRPFYANPATQAGAGIIAVIFLMLGVLFKYRRLIVIAKK